ncbi:MAG: HAMP domain-containing histidine kinase [Propionibacteriaceae bacterium]|jgi:two-component system sensor histidine kinase VanS|nr:HAMP domain-containing histidine kinase [Propionibacteriaceae bacterium]
MSRRPESVRFKLTLSYAGLLVIAGVLLLAVVWLFLLRYVPEHAVLVPANSPGGGRGRPELFIPGRGDLWAAFAPRAAVAMGLLLGFGLVGGWIIAGRMLAPVARITEGTRLAAQGALSHRIELEGPQDEFRELADAFDVMLAKIEAQVGEQRRFAANASHELRTPLAITRSILDVARQDPDADTSQFVERLYDANERAITLTEALLTLSRADQRAFFAEPVDLSLLVDEAVEFLVPLAEQSSVELIADTETAITRGSSALLAQMVTNLAQNAIVHNLSDGGTVRITTQPKTASVVLTVENTGPTLTPESVATLIEPFQRGAERTRGERSGVGLGLAIVNSVVQAHNGTLRLEARDQGGLRVTATLPS